MRVTFCSKILLDSKLKTRYEMGEMGEKGERKTEKKKNEKKEDMQNEEKIIG